MISLRSGSRHSPTSPSGSLRDWFAQFPYLSKLREPQVLAKAISEALARSDAKYAIADRFDEAKGEYVGLKLAQLVTVDLNSDAVLVRREVADAQLAKQAPQTGQLDTGEKVRSSRAQPSVTGTAAPIHTPAAFLRQGHARPKPSHARRSATSLSRS